MNRPGLQITHGEMALSEIEKLKKRVVDLEQRLSESSPLDTIVIGTYKYGTQAYFFY